MLPTKWAEAKREDPRPGDASPTESIVHPAAPGSGSALEKSTHTDSKHTHQARTQVLTPPDRQRTAQACDKCRERKTKCSGDHPVCSRCTTRGLICQYSSREPRPRGPSKARLRNAISSLDLRPPSKTNNDVLVQQGPHRVQGHSQKSMLEHRACFENRHLEHVHRRASMPQLNRDFPEFNPAGSAPREFCGMTMLGYEPSYAGGTATQPQQFSNHKEHHLQQPWTDVRCIQTHFTLDGRNEEDTAMQFGLHGPPPLPMVGSNSYGSFSSRGRVSPTFQLPLPLFERAAVEHFEPQKTQHIEQMYSRGYHSDSSSSGSSAAESLTYSPISSEDAPEPQSRSTSSLGFGSSGPLDLAQANIYHLQPHLQYYALGDRTIYSTQVPPPAVLPFDPLHEVTLDCEREIQAGIEFTNPSPISPIGVDILQEEFFDYLGVEFRTRGDGGKFMEGGISSPIETVN